MIGHHISSSQLSDHSFNSSLHHLLLQLSADQPQVLRGADLLLVELLLHHVVLVDVDLVPDGLDDDPGVGGMPVALSHHVARVAQEDKARPGCSVCEVVVVVSHPRALVLLVIYSYRYYSCEDHISTYHIIGSGSRARTIYVGLGWKQADRI